MSVSKEEIQQAVDTTIDTMRDIALRLIDEGVPPHEALRLAVVQAKEFAMNNLGKKIHTQPI